jgi:hypothetical protein
MRVIVSLSAVLLSTGASAAAPSMAPALDASPALKAQPQLGTSPGVFSVSPRKQDESKVNCRGRIVAARADLGLPKLPDDGAKAGEPLFIAAVAREIDGCEVLVMRDNTSDIRPLPQFADGPGKMIPLGGQ